MRPDDDAAIPFERALEPLVGDACSRLHAQVSCFAAIISPKAQKQLQRSLLRLLSDVCGQVLELAFSLLRFRRDPEWASFAESEGNGGLYDAFVNEMINGRLSDLLAEYPALGNLITLLLEQWTSATSELLARLQHDRSEIAALFATEDDPGLVIGIETDLSDRHDGGRTVVALQFASGLRLIYKPRDLGLEQSFFSILRWFNRNDGPPLHTIRILQRMGYGWVEFVEGRPCQDTPAAERYFQRAGQLLCVIYLLGGADCHFDNIIAFGEHPVLIDAEMLFHPKLSCDNSEHAETVLRTGLLPRPTVEGLDLSGFGCVSDQNTPLRIPDWQAVNSDATALRFRKAVLHPSGNIPAIGQTVLSPLDYVEPMIEGFRAMYRFILKNRAKILASDGPLAGVATQMVRVLARGTLQYYLALSHMLHPKRLRNSQTRWVRLRGPSRFPHLEPLEIKALEQMDVPRFFVQASATHLAASDGARASADFAQTGLERVIHEIQNMNEAHLVSQVNQIQFAWAFSALSRISIGP